MTLSHLTKAGMFNPTKGLNVKNINTTGIITAVDGIFSGNVSIAGTLTYEDVTNIDSVGIITARGDLDVDGHTNLDNVSVAGITTFSASANTLNVNTTTTNSAINIQFDGNTKGSITPKSDALEIGVISSENLIMNLNRFGGSTSDFIVKSNSSELLKVNGDGVVVVTGILTTTDLDVDGHTNLDNVSIAGVTTFTGAITANGEIDLNSDLDVDGHTNLDNVSIAGFTTITQDLDVDGSIGVGIANPSQKIHIDGGNLLISNSTQSGSSAPQIRLNSSSSDGSSTRFTFGLATGSNHFLNGAASNDACIVSPSNMLFGIGGTRKFRIKTTDVLTDVDFIPSANEATSLGRSNARWSDLFVVDANISGNLNVTGILTSTSGSFGPGILEESYINDTGGGIVGNYNHDVLSYGMVWYGVTNAVGGWTFNIRGNSTTTFNSISNTNKVTTMTIYSANNNAANYMSAFNIDGVTQTVKWAGGSAPSVATGSGVDVYSMTIMKTGAGTYHVFGNFTNFA